MSGKKMNGAAPPEGLACHYRSGEGMRSRGVGAALAFATLDIPEAPAAMAADWQREILQRLGLEPGDVEPMPLARTRMRWPGLRRCLQATEEWSAGRFAPDGLLDACEPALMACRGARYHFDAEHYGAAAFCNLFLSEDKGLDLHFPAIGRRIPLCRGTAVLFDTAQPHAVIARHASGFEMSDFASGRDDTQVFLSWELPIEHAGVAAALGVDFDVDALEASRLHEEQVRLGGRRVRPHPATGAWETAD